MGFLKYILVLLVMCIVGLLAMGLSTGSFEYENEAIIPTNYKSTWHHLSMADSLVTWYPGLKKVVLDSGEMDQAPSKYFWTMEVPSGEIDVPVRLVQSHQRDSVEYILQLPEGEKSMLWVVHPRIKTKTLVKAYYTWSPHGLWRRITHPFRSMSMNYQDQERLAAMAEVFPSEDPKK